MHSIRFFRPRKLIAALARVSLVIISMGAAQAATAAVAYIQGNSAVPQTPQWTVSATYTAAQTAGNLNVVAIGWYNTTAHVLSVTDTAGNIYKLAVGPTTQSQAGTQAIYYAPIVAGSAANNNRVVVSFDAAAPFPDLRIAEYSGVAATNPVDTVAASAGSGTTTSSGSLTTANANDLLIGANYVTSHTTGPGSGYTARTITYPDGSILEDRIVTAAGSYSATAPISTGAWIMQLVALRAAGSTTPPPSSPVAFVQRNYAVPQSPQTAVSATFSGAQTAGNLNVVVVGWNDSTATLRSVTDTRGNVYKLAVGPTVNAGNATQAIYYTFNSTSSAANSNTVTATFDSPAAYVDLRIAEYSGISASSPVDVVATGSGSGSTTSTNAVTTTGANDLFLAANTVATSTTGSGTGYTTRVITFPDGDLLEDRIVTAVGSYSATAPLSSPGAWVMQMVAFRGGSAVGSGPPDTQPPSAPGSLASTARSSSQIDLGWSASTDNVGVTRYLVERCQGAGCSSFAQIATATGTAYTNTGLSASTSYSYRVRAQDAAGNLSGYSNVASATTQTGVVTNTPPTISGTPPTSVLAGSAYMFHPTAADADGDPLTFSVSNLPSWATFSTSTGQLSGTPGAADVGNYANIVISVSDGSATVSLPAFTIVVTQIATGSATLSWTPPTQNTDGSALVDLAGYRIHYGTSAGALTQVIQLANPGVSSYVLGNLSSGTYYFAVTAYSSSGAESARSGVGSKVVP